MGKEELILIGGGGHCKSCIEIILSTKLYGIKGVLDVPNKIGESVLGYPIIGSDLDLTKYIHDGFSFLITIGHIESNRARSKLYTLLKNNNAKIATIISPHSSVSQSAEIGEGTIIMHDVIVNASSRIGENCIINNKALIEHDSEVGHNSHISTGALVNGDCKIGSNCFIGSGAVLRNDISIAQGSLVGAGAVVTSSINNQGIYVGNPAKAIQTK